MAHEYTVTTPNWRRKSHNAKLPFELMGMRKLFQLKIMVLLVTAIFATTAQAECTTLGGPFVSETDGAKAARLMCETQVRSCKAQCNALPDVAKREGFSSFMLGNGSQRNTCKNDCGNESGCCSK